MAITDYIPFAESTNPPIITTLPETTRAFVNKYDRLGPTIQTLPPHLRNTIIDFDMKRAMRGQQPISEEQTAHALLSAIRNEAVAEPPEKGLIGNAIEDIKTISSSIFRLPAALAEEVKSLPEIPQHIQEGEGNIVERVATAPGIRMLPGAFVASNVAGGTPGELAKHPVFTLLDVAPYGVKAAKLTPQARLAATEATQAGEAGRYVPRIGPVRAALTRTIQDGATVPNRIGRIGTAVLQTRGGGMLSEMWGGQARETTRLGSIQDSIVQELTKPLGREMGSDAQKIVGHLVRQADQIATKHGIDPAREAELTRLMQYEPERFPNLPGNELAFVNEVRDIANAYARESISYGLLPGAIGDEIFPQASYNKITNAQNLLNTRVKRMQKEILPHMQRKLAEDPQPATNFQEVINTLILEDWQSAQRLMNNMMKKHTRPGEPGKVGVMAPAGKMQLATLRKFATEIKKVSQAKKDYDKAVKRTPPARFLPMLQKAAARKYQDQYFVSHPNLDPEDAANIAQYVNDEMYDMVPGFNKKELRKIQRDVQATWQTLKDSGADPVFVHHVTPLASRVIEHPHVAETLIDPTQIRERMMDAKPATDNVTVALKHQGVELLSRMGSEEYIAQLIEKFGDNEQNLLKRYEAAAKVKLTSDPSYNFKSAIYELMRREWVPYNPYTKGVNWKSARLTGLDPERVWLPRTVANTLDKLRLPREYRIAGIMDPVMGVFRTSILPLSARWHVYNIMGGAAMLGARTGPAAFAKLPLAWKMARGQISMDDLPVELRATMSNTRKAYAELDYRAGRTFSRLWDQIQQHKMAKGVVTGAGKFINWSYDVNSLFDDTYKVAAYLYGTDKALAKGLTKEASVRAGLELSQKILQQWTDLTPIERTILRYVFPFYSFMQHIFRYTYTYPIDHPIRTSITAAFARAELEDMGTALPQSFLNSFFIGDMDENGQRHAINLQGMNPFRDVSNFMTMAGFVKASNPIIATVLQELGIDISTGGPELYPNLSYDATSGRLAVDTGNPLINLVQNVLPHSRILFELGNTSSEFQQLLRTNPDAAMRLIHSQAGLPILLRDINVPQEIYKAELARKQSAEDAFREALRTGDYTEASRYPQLRPLLAYVQQLQSTGQLNQLTPPTLAPSTVETIQGGLLRL